MTIKQPLWLENLVYSATEMRRFLADFFPAPGCFEFGDLAVTQHAGGAAMSVDVVAGDAIIAGTSLAGQGSYLFSSDATVTLTIAAAPGSGQSRIDLVVARIEDADQDGGSNNQGVLAVVGGTAASTGSEVAPAAPASCLVLAHVLVGPSVSTIVTGDITDERTFASGTNPDSGWLNLTLINGWGSVGDVARYRKLNGMVTLELTVDSSSASATELAVLPPGFRPAVGGLGNIGIPCIVNNSSVLAVGHLTVGSDGSVVAAQISGGVPTTYLYWGTITFPADA